MSKRIICDISFILIGLIAFLFYIGGHDFSIKHGFVITCILLVILLLIISYFVFNICKKTRNFYLIISILLLSTLISYIYIGYKEEFLSAYLIESKSISGILYFDDSVHKENGNLIVKIKSPLNIKLQYKIRIYDNESQLKNVREGSIINIKYKSIYIKDKSNYGEFDYKNYLKGTGILKVLAVDELIEVDSRGESRIYFYREISLKKIYKSLQYIFSDDGKVEFLYALLSGSKSALDKDILDLFAITSTVHLLTVSGFHFAILYMCMERFMFFIKIPRNLKLLLLIFMMFFYYIITPMKFSCFRALIMILILIVSKFINRQFDFMCALAFVVILSLVLNPYVIYDLSFVLTYLACLGIGVIYKSFFELESRIKIFPRLIRNSISVFILSISIQTSLLLYYLASSTDINFISPLINIPLSFMISILMTIMIPYFILVDLDLLKYISPIFDIPSFLIDSIYAQIRYFAGIDKLIYNLSTYKYMLFPLIISLLILLFLKQNIKKLSELDLLVYMAVIILLIIFPANLASNQNNLKIIFNDVGQGDSAMIITEDNSSILIDLGDGKIDVSKLTKAYGVDKIDILIFSHNHKDHVGGGKDWISEMDVAMIIAPLHMKEELKDSSSDIHIIEERKKITIDSLKIDIIPLYLSEKNLNDSAIVVKVTKDDFDVLFTGDIEKDTEELLLGNDILKSIEILKVPHHGSKTSSTKAFVDNIRPTYAIVAVGENRYSHPNLQVLERYEEAGSRVIVLREYGQSKFTYKEGDLEFTSYFKMKN